MQPTRGSGRLPRTAAKLRRTRDPLDPLRIAIYGDSLALADSERGGWDAWASLLFDPAAPDATYYLGAHFPYAPIGKDVMNRAVGGTTIHLVAAHVAIDEHGRCPALDDPVDLAIICAGENGGGRNAEIHELIVRRLREVGTDVILVASNTRVGDRAHGADRARAYRAIADHHDCALADVNEAYRVALADGDAGRRGGKTEPELFLDAVHQTPEGYRLYAATILDVLKHALTHRDDMRYVRPRTSVFAHPGIPAELNDDWRELVRVTFGLAVSGTQVRRQVGAADPVKDPRSGRAAGGEYVLPADANGEDCLRFDVDGAVAVDLIVGGGTSSVSVADDHALTRSVSYSVREYRVSVIELLTPEDVGVVDGTRPDGLHGTLRVCWESGDPVRVLGAVVYG